MRGRVLSVATPGEEANAGANASLQHPTHGHPTTECNAEASSKEGGPPYNCADPGPQEIRQQQGGAQFPEGRSRQDR